MMLTTTSKVNNVKKLAKQEDIEQAVLVADKIDIKKVTSIHDLGILADVYIKASRLGAAKQIYIEMHERAKTHKVMVGLIDICLKTRDAKLAETYLREFRKMEPDNPERLIFRYRVDCLLGKSNDYLLRSLTKLKDEDYTEVWALELAKVYYKSGDMVACANECRDILLWFSGTECAEKAKVLLSACSDESVSDKADEDEERRHSPVGEEDYTLQEKSEVSAEEQIDGIVEVINEETKAEIPVITDVMTGGTEIAETKAEEAVLTKGETDTETITEIETETDTETNTVAEFTEASLADDDDDEVVVRGYFTEDGRVALDEDEDEFCVSGFFDEEPEIAAADEPDEQIVVQNIEPVEITEYVEQEEETEDRIVEEQVDEIVEEPTEELVEEPAEEIDEAPTEESVEESVEEAIEEVVEVPVEETITEPVDETITEPVDETIAEPMEENLSDTKVNKDLTKAALAAVFREDDVAIEKALYDLLREEQ